MVEIQYKKGAITVKGHAGSGRYGQDLVCAGVSALILTLAEAVKRWEEKKLLECREITLSSGQAVIRWSDAENQVKLGIEGICAGFARLAKLYPEYVRYCGDSPESDKSL